MKILHILYQSTPDTAGSSIRSRDLVASQLIEGIVPIVITSPFQNSRDDKKSIEVIQNYFFLKSDFS